jgi:hypothetical protein
MDDHIQSVGPLKKVSLEVAAGTTKEITDLSHAPELVEFIFGIGVEGLTPFECAIDGKIAGEEVTVKIPSAQRKEFFGHLMGCASKNFGDVDPLYLHFRIQAVSDSSPREIVKAMADDSGCGGSCDCGCESH